MEEKTHTIELDNISLSDFPTFTMNRDKGYTINTLQIEGLDYNGLHTYILGLLDCVCLALENDNTEKHDLISIRTTVELIKHFLPQIEEMNLLDKIALKVSKIEM